MAACGQAVRRAGKASPYLACTFRSLRAAGAAKLREGAIGHPRHNEYAVARTHLRLVNHLVVPAN